MKAFFVLAATFAFSAHAVPVATGSAKAVKSLTDQNMTSEARSLYGPDPEEEFSTPQPDGPLQPPPTSNRPAILPNVDPMPGDTAPLNDPRPQPVDPRNPGAPYPSLIPSQPPGSRPSGPSMPSAPSMGPSRARPFVSNEIPLDELIGVEGLRKDMEAEGITADTAYLHRVADVKVFVVVDKYSQTISISSPETRDRPEQYPEGWVVRKISTGGGLKHPVVPDTGEPDKPYCADDVTPNVTEVIVPAIEGQTMFRKRRSNRFEVDMPFAIAVPGHPGIFLHEVPAGKTAQGVRYADLLGQNVSGGCIRLDKQIAQWLYEIMQLHGSIQLSIVGDNPGPAKCYKNEYGEAVAAGTPQRARPRQDIQPGVEVPPDYYPGKPVGRVPPQNPVGDFFRGIFNL